MFHVIEDYDELGSVLQEIMSYSGYESRIFRSAEAYLAYVDDPSFAPPVAIISDYALPGINGIQLVRQIRKRRDRQKAVIISALSKAEPVPPLLCYWLPKPFAIETLLSLLEAVLHCEQDCIIQDVSFSSQCQYGMDTRCPFYQHHQH